MKYLRIAFLGIALMLGPDLLLAQQIPSPYRFIEETQSAGAFAGYLWTNSDALDLGPRPAPIVGLRYSIRLSGPVAGEASLGFMPSERTVFTNAATSGDTTEVVLQEVGVTNMRILLAEAGLRFSLTGARTWNGLAPYVIGAGGVVADLAGQESVELDEDERFDFGPGFAVGLGAGTEWFVGQRFSLRAEIRDQIWRISIPSGLRATGQDEARWTNNFGVTLGAALHF
jgi:hypothetical protein